MSATPICLSACATAISTTDRAEERKNDLVKGVWYAFAASARQIETRKPDGLLGQDSAIVTQKSKQFKGFSSAPRDMFKWSQERTDWTSLKDPAVESPGMASSYVISHRPNATPFIFTVCKLLDHTGVTSLLADVKNAIELDLEDNEEKALFKKSN